jgi:hypothetical protein
MADDVNITGIDPNAFKNAMERLPAWATEDAARDIETLLRKSLDIQTKALTQLVKSATSSGTALTPDDINKLKKGFDNFFKDLEKAHKQAKVEQKDNDEAEKDRKSQKKDQEELGKGSKFLALAWVSLIALSSKVYQVQKDYFETTKKITDAGVYLTLGTNGSVSSLMTLNQIVSDTGLRMQTFADSIKEFSSAINAIGAVKFSKTLKTAQTDLGRLGYSSTEAARLMADMVDSESAYMDLRQLSTQEMAYEAYKYGDQMIRMSMMTGQSIEKLKQNNKELSNNTATLLVASKYGPEAATRLKAFISAIGDQNVGKMIYDLAAQQVPALTQAGKALIQAGAGPIADQLTNIGKQAMSGAITAEQALEQSSNLVGNLTSSQIENLGLLAQAGNEGAAQVLQMVQAMRKQQYQTSQMSEEEKEAAIKSKKVQSDFDTALEKFKSNLQKLFPLLDFSVQVATGILESINWVAEAIESVTNKQIAGISAGVLSIVAFAGTVWAAVKSLKIFGIAVDLVKTLLGKKKEAPGVDTSLPGGTGNKNKIGTVANQTANQIPAQGGKAGKAGKVANQTANQTANQIPAQGGKAGKAGKPAANQGTMGVLGKIGQGIGQFIAGIGTGAGQAISGILSGVAKGLSAMANPRVFMGIIALGLLGGALWLFGKSLEDFLKIKAEDFAATIAMIVGGVAALGVTAGLMGAFIGPVALGALALAGISVSLMLFAKSVSMGADSMKDLAAGLKDFSQVSGENLIAVAKGMVALSAAMVAFTAGSAVSAVGGIFTSIGNGISKLFGGGSAIDQLKQFVSIGQGLAQASGGINGLATGISALSASLSSFTGVEKITNLVNQINKLDVAKAAMFGTLAKQSHGAQASPLGSPISPSKIPAQSTISTPDFNAPVKHQDKKKDEKKPRVQEQAAPISDTASPTNEINNILAQQTAVLQQMLTETRNLVSVNRDILKYTRVN